MIKEKKAGKELRDSPLVSLDEEPMYGMEALIGTISDRRELIKALKKASKHDSNFGIKSTLGLN